MAYADKDCAECGKPFTPKRFDMRFCRKQCGDAYTNQRRPKGGLGDRTGARDNQGRHRIAALTVGEITPPPFASGYHWTHVRRVRAEH